MTAPSQEAIFERAFSLCNEACFTVALQHRRLRTAEPEDRIFIFRWWADLQFLIVALRRLRTAARIATQVSNVEPDIAAAIDSFDKALPDLEKMRNVGEHIRMFNRVCRSKLVAAFMLSSALVSPALAMPVSEFKSLPEEAQAERLGSMVNAVANKLREGGYMEQASCLSGLFAEGSKDKAPLGAEMVVQQINRMAQNKDSVEVEKVVSATLQHLLKTQCALVKPAEGVAPG